MILSNIAIGIRESKYRQQSKKFGNLNPKVYFYVIRIRPPGWGFFSNVFYVLQGLQYAEENGWTPVVDMENYYMSEMNSLRTINGTRNSWNYFFEQVSKYDLHEVYKSKNVILSDGNRISVSTSWLRNRNTELIESPKKMELVGNLINKYINLNSTTRMFLEKTKHDLLWNGTNTLGIFVRGSVYHSNVQFPKNTIVEFDLLVKEIKNFLVRHEFDAIYICTEDLRVYLKLSQIFKKYKILPSIRFEQNLSVDNWIKQQKTTNIGGLYNVGFSGTKKYLAEIFLLSECTNFIGTFSNATTFVIAKSMTSGGNKRLLMANGSQEYNQ
jgi:hypothetical protein